MKYLKSFNINEGIDTIVSKIRKNLTPDLLKGMWKKDDPQNYSGYCYVATEALYWMLGAKESNYTPCVLGHKEWPEGLSVGETHWFLKNKFSNKVIDPTKEQFGNLIIPYEKGRPNGMMNHPIGGSKRCRILIDRIKK